MQYRLRVSMLAGLRHMRLIKVLVVGIVAAGSVFVLHTSNFSIPADAKKTDKSCIHCHIQSGSKELTEAGKYYRDKGTLDGYKKK